MFWRTKKPLAYNKFGDEGMKEIGSALQVNCSLTSLSLGKIWLVVIVAVDIELLSEIIAVIVIIIGDNGIGNEGAKAIAAALSASSTLRILDLSKLFLIWAEP